MARSGSRSAAGATRNSIFFQRPSAGVWHHYAIVIDTTAASGSEITPYVDGVPVSYQQEGAAGGQGNFANSTLYLMSRAGSSLFGTGTLDQLAIYNQAAERGDDLPALLLHGVDQSRRRPPSPRRRTRPGPGRA